MRKKILSSNWTILALLFSISVVIIASPWGPQGHSAQDVAIVFGLPVVLFDTVVLQGIARLLCLLPAHEVEQPTLPLSAYPDKIRLIAKAVLIVLGVCVMLLAGSIALLLASCFYPWLDLGWAAQSARWIGVWVLCAAFLPAAILLVYITGIATARRAASVAQLAQQELPSLPNRFILHFLRTVA